jgi:RNA polymerase sigma-70 factor (ECF subfamily)
MDQQALFDERSELVAAAANGDVAAQHELLVGLRSPVHRYCRARLGGGTAADDAADDVAQEVIVAVLQALPRYRSEGRPFEAFVFGIAAHKVADAQRAFYRTPTPVAQLPDGADLERGPEDVAVQTDGARAARRLLDYLPPRQRDLLLLRVIVGLSAEETGRALDMSPGAVRVAQHRALARLRTLLATEAVR